MATEASDSLASLWNFGDPKASESRFRAWLDRPDVADSPEDSAEGLTQLARALGLQRRFDEAEAELQRAETLLDTRPAQRTRVRLLLERGRILNSAGDRVGAKPLFLAAWELASATPCDDLAVDAAHMVAIVEEPPNQAAWNEKALSLARSSTDPAARRWVGSLLNNLAWNCHDAGETQRALELFEEALAFRREQGDEEGIRIARWSVARAKRTLGRLEEALAEQLSILESMAGSLEDGYVSEEIGECLLALGRAAESLPHFANAHRLLSQDPWLAQNEPGRLERLGRLAAAS